MKCIHTLLIITIFTCSTYTKTSLDFSEILNSPSLETAIEESNLIEFATALKHQKLSLDEKQRLLDLAQEIINKRRDEVFLVNLRASKELFIIPIVCSLAILGLHLLYKNFNVHKDILFNKIANIQYILLASFGALGTAVGIYNVNEEAKTKTLYSNALKIKQLIFNA